MFQFLEPGVVTVAYIAATILFILALGGLSNPETARRGNLYGMTGMGIALLATVFGVVSAHYELLVGAIVIGGAIGVILARKIQMTQMPELVAPSRRPTAKRGRRTGRRSRRRRSAPRRYFRSRLFSPAAF